MRTLIHKFPQHNHLIYKYLLNTWPLIINICNDPTECRCFDELNFDQWVTIVEKLV
jgi:hypothetical protein